MHKVMKTGRCPNCNSTKEVKKVHIVSCRLPWWWYIMCDNCKWCGKTKLFLFRAIKSWNKESIQRKRGGTRRHDGDEREML